jgi:hypothetical protein
MNQDEQKLFDDIDEVIYKNKKVNDEEVSYVLQLLLNKYSKL